MNLEDIERDYDPAAGYEGYNLTSKEIDWLIEQARENQYNKKLVKKRPEVPARDWFDINDF